MTTTLTASRTSLSDLIHTLARLIRREDQHTTVAAALTAELQTARLVPAVFVPGIEHQTAAAILHTGLPTVTYQRRTLTRRLDEHLFLDVDARAGVRVLACWDDRAHRVRMHVGVVGERVLWDRIVMVFTEWEMTGRPVPSTPAVQIPATRRPGSTNRPTGIAS